MIACGFPCKPSNLGCKMNQVSQPQTHRAFMMKRVTRGDMNPEPTSEHERFLRLFITNGGGW
jgi:hypothetical protein